MITRYELIKDLENDPRFFTLIKKGIISLSLLSIKCYYERYLSELQTNPVTQAAANAAEEFKVSERTIYRAIKYMEEC